jgi:uncharacterized membrane protein YfcA
VRVSLALFAFGIIVGVLSGLLGIGGGVVLVPGLMLLFGFSQPAAQGTSLTVLSLPIAAFAAVVYYQYGHVRLPVAGLIACGFAVGAFGGAKLVPHLPVATLRIGFAGLMFYIAFMMAADVHSTKSKAALPAFVAAAVSLVAARLFHRKFTHPPAVEPPDGHTEYHI